MDTKKTDPSKTATHPADLTSASPFPTAKPAAPLVPPKPTTAVAGAPKKKFIKIGDEVIEYANKTSTQFTGLKRRVNGGKRTDHPNTGSVSQGAKAHLTKGLFADDEIATVDNTEGFE